MALIENVIYTRQWGFLTGEKHTGKTTLALQTGVCAALGIPIFDFKIPKPLKVLIINSEDDEHAIRYRIHSIEEGLRYKRGASSDNLSIYALDTYEEDALKYEKEHEKKAPSMLDIIEKLLLSKTKKDEEGNTIGNEYDLAIFDNLRSLSPGLRENDPAAMSEAGTLYANIRSKAGLAVLVLAHPPKASDPDRAASYGPSGSGASNASARVSMALKKHAEDKHTVWDIQNSISAPCQTVYSWQRAPFLVGTPDKDPSNVWRPGKRGGGGREKEFTEEMILNLFPDFKTEIKAADLWDMCRQNYNMSKSTAQRLIGQLKDSGEVESQNGVYKRKFTANENM